MHVATSQSDMFVADGLSLIHLDNSIIRIEHA
jgi:hypothetical protein